MPGACAVFTTTATRIIIWHNINVHGGFQSQFDTIPTLGFTVGHRGRASKELNHVGRRSLSSRRAALRRLLWLMDLSGHPPPLRATINEQLMRCRPDTGRDYANCLVLSFASLWPPRPLGFLFRLVSLKKQLFRFKLTFPEWISVLIW